MKVVIPILFFLLSIQSFAIAKEKRRLFEETQLLINCPSFNTNLSDISPALVGNLLFFSSRKVEMSSHEKNTFYDIFSTPLDSNGNVIGNRQTVESLHTPFHDGPVCFCSHTNQLFVTRTDIEKSKILRFLRQRDHYNLKLEIIDNFGKPNASSSFFKYNNKGYSIGHPAVRAGGGDTLIFASDMRGGYGGADLYMSVRRNGEWGLPQNLGPEVNSEKEEVFPFICEDGTLIFASSRNGGLGGLDLYYSYFKDGVYEKPVNFGPSINSQDDDFSFVMNETAEWGYFSSNRHGMGSDDIYFVKINRPSKQAEEKVIDALPKNGNLVANADIQIKLNESTQDTVILTPKILNKKFALNNIYYDLNKWNILPESEIELNKLVKLLQDNTSIIVELGSHTDSRGNNDYNMVLSQKRGQSAVNYIISKGVEASRIIAKGYGKTQLINKCANGIKCSE
ncbi:MAG: OmpA family protein, partial [Bacteroidota bacterium]|nr:OmpA family protein [Bacteroidota bacterium]